MALHRPNPSCFSKSSVPLQVWGCLQRSYVSASLLLGFLFQEKQGGKQPGGVGAFSWCSLMQWEHVLLVPGVWHSQPSCLLFTQLRQHPGSIPHLLPQEPWIRCRATVRLSRVSRCPQAATPHELVGRFACVLPTACAAEAAAASSWGWRDGATVWPTTVSLHPQAAGSATCHHR